MLHVGLELVVADHRVSEETELLTGLMLLVVHQFIGEVSLDHLLDFGSLFFVLVGQDLVSQDFGLVVGDMVNWRFFF